MMRPPCGVLVLHDFEGLLRAEKRAGQVRIDHGSPGLELDVLQQHAFAAKAGVIEQQVEPAESLFRLRKKLSHRVRIGDVRRYGEHLDIGIDLLHFSHSRFQALHAPAGKNQRVPVLSERDSDDLCRSRYLLR